MNSNLYLKLSQSLTAQTQPISQLKEQLEMENFRSAIRPFPYYAKKRRALQKKVYAYTESEFRQIASLSQRAAFPPIAADLESCLLINHFKMHLSERIVYCLNLIDTLGRSKKSPLVKVMIKIKRIVFPLYRDPYQELARRFKRLSIDSYPPSNHPPSLTYTQLGQLKTAFDRYQMIATALDSSKMTLYLQGKERELEVSFCLQRSQDYKARIEVTLPPLRQPDQRELAFKICQICLELFQGFPYRLILRSRISLPLQLAGLDPYTPYTPYIYFNPYNPYLYIAEDGELQVKEVFPLLTRANSPMQWPDWIAKHPLLAEDKKKLPSFFSKHFSQVSSLQSLCVEKLLQKVRLAIEQKTSYLPRPAQEIFHWPLALDDITSFLHSLEPLATIAAQGADESKKEQ